MKSPPKTATPFAYDMAILALLKLGRAHAKTATPFTYDMALLAFLAFLG